MKKIYFDFETYYDRAYSLRKMTPVEYILDSRYETIMCAIAEDDNDPFVLEGDECEDYFKSIAGPYMAVSHNALFDACILAFRYNIHPPLLVDTMGMARALLMHREGLQGRVSLDRLSTYLDMDVGQKGHFIINVLGLRRDEIIEQELWLQLSAYAIQDVKLCRAIYLTLRGKFPASEHAIMDMVLRMATQPMFRADRDKLVSHLGAVQEAKQALLDRCGLSDRDMLLSNDKFADALRRLGVEPPTKVSPITGKTTLAFAKTDEAFTVLADHDSPDVQALMAARFGVKSTLEESRTERLLSIADSTTSTFGEPLLPVPLRYSGAHTHRLSGDWKINLQNLPTRKSNDLREALVAPVGHVVLAVDAAQIEARLVAWLAGQQDLVDQFDRGEDVYSIFAGEELYGYPVDKSKKPERFLGKKCIASGSRVLTMEGWKVIENITIQDKLWDGVEWVSHQGLLINGYKETLNLCGLRLTPEHPVLCGTKWLEAQYLAHDANILSQALATGAANLPLLGTFAVYGMGLAPLSSSAIAPFQNTLWTRIVSKISSLRGVLTAAVAPARLNSIGATLRRSRMTTIAADCLIVWPVRSNAATILAMPTTITTGGEAFQFARNGGATAQHFSRTFKPFVGGMIHLSKWIASIITGGMNPATSDLPPGVTTWRTGGPLRGCKTRSLVYDIACAGPRNRFTVWSEKGPLIVHNCILGCGFGMGEDKFFLTLAAEAFDNGIDLDIEHIKSLKPIKKYREKYTRIVRLWRWLDAVIYKMANPNWEGTDLGPLKFRFGRVDLPSGLSLFYEGLRKNENDEWTFYYGGRRKKLYGGKLLENIIQALDRILVLGAALRIARRTGAKLRHQVHDDLIYLPRVGPEFAALRLVALEEMSRRPEWGPGLPLMAEAKAGPNYGDLHATTP